MVFSSSLWVRTSITTVVLIFRIGRINRFMTLYRYINLIITVQTSNGRASTKNRYLSILRNYSNVGRGTIHYPNYFRSISNVSFLVNFKMSSTSRRRADNYAQVSSGQSNIRIAFNRPFRRFCRITLCTRRSAFNFKVARASVMFSCRQFTFRISRPRRSRSFVNSAFYL